MIKKPYLKMKFVQNLKFEKILTCIGVALHMACLPSPDPSLRARTHAQGHIVFSNEKKMKLDKFHLARDLKKFEPELQL